MYSWYALTLLLSMGGISAELSTQYKATILDRHNELRRKQQSTNINKLEWDDTLAKEADAWIAQCDMRHEMKGRGENLAFATVDADQTDYTDVLLGQMQDWYDEINQYQGGACGRSCHYTQLVWYKTNKVGCAHRLCSTMRAGGTNMNLMGKKALFFGCWYSPAGNKITDTPFIKGPECTACLEGQTCDKGLCAGEGKEKCVNLEKTGCAGWAAIGDCEKRKDWMKENCRLACGYCKVEGTAECKDLDASCAKFGGKGGKYMQQACAGNKQWMADNCAKSCGLC